MDENATGDITLLLRQAATDDPDSLSRVCGLLYAELRKIARGIARGGQDTLTPTVLVNEAYLRLCGNESLNLESRKHFYATAAQAMRWIVVDHARRAQTGRHGGDLVRVELEDNLLQETRPEEVLALDAALDQLQKIDPARRELVELRFFAGLDYAELAPMLGRSERTLKREWAAARAALQTLME
ncbi:RNA polymerase subunit sigma [Pseudoxanthomonas kalamensis DSM 18571]|uniref:ECF-type sigma factor n=1 Tax=Pseudoxanthomonas kalamensis TaxID=289483 RepID=UPI001391B0A8|nr:ECF-type sigma factor [Pseudoxanthomonas kalamensis]KAF1711254.1 RNA polymerase subunit sigma [Pseudoxanthomonas kalamensis DSM 18571]